MLDINKTMSSREIADLTGKRHDHVLRDCDTLNENYEKLGLPKLGEGLYNHPNTGTQSHRQCFLTRIQTYDLMTGYNVELRIKVNRRWEELELLQKQQQAIDLTNPDTILTIVQNWKKAEDDRQRLQLTTEIQQKELSEAAPKVEYYNEVMQSESLIPTNIIAKELGMSAVSLNKLLNQLNIIYRSGETWVLYHKYQNKGYTGTKTVTYQDSLDNKRTAVHTYWTEVGREFIHHVVKEYSKQKIAS